MRGRGGGTFNNNTIKVIQNGKLVFEPRCNKRNRHPFLDKVEDFYPSDKNGEKCH